MYASEEFEKGAEQSAPFLLNGIKNGFFNQTDTVEFSLL